MEFALLEDHFFNLKWWTTKEGQVFWSINYYPKDGKPNKVEFIGDTEFAVRLMMENYLIENSLIPKQ